MEMNSWDVTMSGTSPWSKKSSEKAAHSLISGTHTFSLIFQIIIHMYAQLHLSLLNDFQGAFISNKSSGLSCWPGLKEAQSCDLSVESTGHSVGCNLDLGAGQTCVGVSGSLGGRWADQVSRLQSLPPTSPESFCPVVGNTVSQQQSSRMFFDATLLGTCY